MKYIIVLLTSFLFFACQSEQEKQKSIKDSQSTVLDSTSTNYELNYRIVTLDSCQYIVIGHVNCAWGSHKGDCTNPIHQPHIITN